jgi:purine-binding chemotaxis protein CheW
MAEINQNGKKGEHGNQYLSFYIKDEMFAINVFYVKEIIQYTQITRVPMMQSFLVGITNIRGNVISVIDLADRLVLNQSKVDKKTCIITIETLIEGEETEIGIVVDVVDQVYDIMEDHRMDAPEFGSKIRKDFISMIAKIDDKFITLLDMDAILNIHELSKIVENKVA